MKVLLNKTLRNFMAMFVSLSLIEIIFRLVSKLSLLDYSVIRILLGMVILSGILSFILSFTGKKVRNVCTILIIIIASIYAIVQAAFNNYLGTYMSFATATQAQAIGDFAFDFIGSIRWQYYLMLIPFVIFLVLYIMFNKKLDIYESNLEISFIDKIKGKKKKKAFLDELNNKKKKNLVITRIVFACISVLSIVGYYFTLTLDFMQNDLQMIDNVSLFKNPSMPNIAISQFGIETFALLDISTLIMPDSNDEIAYENNNNVDVEEDYRRVFDDSAWIELNNNETVKDYKTLNNYFMSKPITPKNEYTGMFEGKNLIIIMIESGSNVLLNYPEYFPNMNKVYNEGWSWDNAFSPRNACSTGNNEMSGITSLYTINRNCTANVYKDNTYYEAIFNLFNNKNYNVTSYHDYDEHFYYRKTYHPNMGSQAYYNIDDLDVKRLGDLNVQPWPSDEEFIEKALPKYIDEDKFMAWMTTVSSHMKYYYSSATGDMFLDLFEKEKWDLEAKRYMSKLKIVDNAIGKLLEMLEESGKLDDTVIMLYADHEPYGMNEEVFQQIAKYDVLTSTGDVDRTPFIIYNSKLTPTKYDEYTSFINILPTLANLFDLDFDPRLYGGEDLLSDTYTNVVAFADGSWRSDIAYFDATTSNITYLTDKTYTNEEIKKINNKIKTEMEMDNLAIKRDYFSYLNNKLNKGFKPGQINISSKNK
jgi:phosphoglycerol transferase MdoB-like AlkP superfamily enzyme